jgi:leucyl aminopeptidase
MQYFVTSLEHQASVTDCFILGVFEGQSITTIANPFAEPIAQFLTDRMQREGFTGESSQTLFLHDIPSLKESRILLLGAGKEAEFNETIFHKLVDKAIKFLKTTKLKDATFCLLDLSVKQRDTAWKMRQMVTVITDGLYTFDQFKSKKENAVCTLTKINFATQNNAEIKAAEQALKEATAITVGMKLAKDLGNLPANICTPTYLAEQAIQLANEHSALKTTVLEEVDMQKLGMGALLAVARGSHQPAKLIVVEYHGADKNKKPIVLVGKGVTFDTGGISLKPAPGMEEMKYDMCGAASVLGTLKAAATLALPINVIGVIPATENLPGGNATRPGDVVTTLSGQTVEILNTDAEGRLILCDALTYSERFEPAAVIDIATLTGAVITALGSLPSGLMSNDPVLIADIEQAANQSWDRVWPLPLWEDYQELINSNIADIANLSEGTGAKTITAGCFLARFAKKFPWAHLDIAGTAWKSGRDKAASGRPVPLLVTYLVNKSNE